MSCRLRLGLSRYWVALGRSDHVTGWEEGPRPSTPSVPLPHWLPCGVWCTLLSPPISREVRLSRNEVPALPPVGRPEKETKLERGQSFVEETPRPLLLELQLITDIKCFDTVSLLSIVTELLTDRVTD